MPKKLSIAALKRKLWRIMSEYVRLKASNVEGYVYCYTCNLRMHYKEAHAAHLFSRKAHPGAYFDLDNIRPCCVRCNTFMDGNIATFTLRITKELGRKRIEELELRAKAPKKWTRLELDELIEEYTKKLKALKEERSISS